MRNWSPTPLSAPQMGTFYYFMPFSTSFSGDSTPELNERSAIQSSRKCRPPRALHHRPFFLLSIVVFAILICYIHKYFLSCQTALRFIETSAVSMEPEHNTYQAKRWFERCFVCVACVSFYGLFIQCIICGKMHKMSHVLQFIAAPPPPSKVPTMYYRRRNAEIEQAMGAKTHYAQNNTTASLTRGHALLRQAQIPMSSGCICKNKKIKPRNDC